MILKLFLFTSAILSIEIGARDGEKITLMISEAGKAFVDLKIDGKDVHIPIQEHQKIPQIKMENPMDLLGDLQNNAEKMNLDNDGLENTSVQELFSDNVRDPSVFSDPILKRKVLEFNRDLLGYLNDAEKEKDSTKAWQRGSYTEDYVDEYLKKIKGHLESNDTPNTLSLKKMESLESMYREFFKNLRTQAFYKGEDFNLLRQNLRTINSFVNIIDLEQKEYEEEQNRKQMEKEKLGSFI